MKDASVSPIRPAPRQTWPPTHTREAATHTREAATQTLASAPPERPSCGHRRARFEGDSLFYERKAREVFRRVKKISWQLRDMAHPQGADDTRSGGGGGRAHELISQSTEPRVETLPLNQTTNSQQPHKCSFQQQVKTLQRKLRSLNKQVCASFSYTCVDIMLLCIRMCTNVQLTCKVWIRALCTLHTYWKLDISNSERQSLSVVYWFVPDNGDFGECMCACTIHSPMEEREDYWYRELCTLNDNVRGVGNLSKCDHNIVVHTLFNKHQRKFRKATLARAKGKLIWVL